MKKTTTINLNGAVIHIDEDAYQQLAVYLDNLKKHFEGEDGAEEILNDIESRIGDLFRTRLRYGIEVVTIRDVNEVIEIMGQPEDFDCDVLGEDDDRKEATSEKFQTVKEKDETAVPPVTEKREKILFRDPDNAYLGGVASGLSWYLGIDAVWIRLLLIILTFCYGASILVYLLFWIIVPQARTAPQKMQMKGEPITVDTITQNVKGEKEKSSETATASSGSKTSFAKTLLRVIFILLAIVVGTVFVVFLLPSLLILIPVLFLGANLLDTFMIPHLGPEIGPMAHSLAGSIPLMLGLFFVLGIPILALLRVILVNLTNGVFSKTINWLLVIGWLIGFVLLIFGSLHTFTPFFNHVNTMLHI